MRAFSAPVFLPTSTARLWKERELTQVLRRFTAVAHIAGTEGDRLSALRVKSQWEELLGLPLSGDDNVLEAGTKESREALTGKSCWKGHGKAHTWWRRVLRRVPGAKRWLRRRRRSAEKPRVWVDSYYPVRSFLPSSFFPH